MWRRLPDMQRECVCRERSLLIGAPLGGGFSDTEISVQVEGGEDVIYTQKLKPELN